jgi:hypothetical protein
MLIKGTQLAVHPAPERPAWGKGQAWDVTPASDPNDVLLSARTKTEAVRRARKIAELSK